MVPGHCFHSGPHPENWSLLHYHCRFAVAPQQAQLKKREQSTPYFALASGTKGSAWDTSKQRSIRRSGLTHQRRRSDAISHFPCPHRFSYREYCDPVLPRTQCPFRRKSLRSPPFGAEFLESGLNLDQLRVLDALARLVKRHRALPKIRLIRHVARQRCMIAEHRILDHRLSRPHRLEEPPQVRLQLIVRNTAIGRSSVQQLLAWWRIMFRVPLLQVLLPHCSRKRLSRVVAGRSVDAWLRNMRDGAFAHLDVPLRPLEAHDLRTLRPQVEPCVNRYIAIFEQGRMYIGHVPAVFPAQNAAHRHGPLRWLIQVQREHDPADHVHQQIARNPGAVLLPAAPAREKQRIERAFRSSPLPHVPVECLGRKVGRRWILPVSRGIVASQRALHQAQVSNRPLREQFFRLPVNRRTHTLRSDLHELSRLLLRRRHIEAIGD